MARPLPIVPLQRGFLGAVTGLPIAQIVARGLRLNGIGCVMLGKAREAVRSFLADDTCRVFLLGLRQGAAGLTLVRGAATSAKCRVCLPRACQPFEPFVALPLLLTMVDCFHST